jgi:hypothetical protein
MILSYVTDEALEKFLESSGFQKESIQKWKQVFLIGYRSGAADLARDVLQDLDGDHMSPGDTYSMLGDAIDGKAWKKAGGE